MLSRARTVWNLTFRDIMKATYLRIAAIAGTLGNLSSELALSVLLSPKQLIISVHLLGAHDLRYVLLTYVPRGLILVLLRLPRRHHILAIDGLVRPQNEVLS